LTALDGPGAGGTSVGSRITGDTVATVAAQVLGLAVTLALTPFQLERMGYVRYGLVSLVISVVGLFTFLDYGLSWAALRYVAALRIGRRKGEADDVASLLVAVALGLGLIIAGVAVATTVVAAIFKRRELGLDSTRLELIGLGALLLPALMTSNILLSVARAIGGFRLAAAVSTSYFVTTNVVWALAAGRAHDVVVVLSWQVFFLVLMTIFWFWYLRRHGLSNLRIPRRPGVASDTRRTILVFAGFSALTGLSTTLFATADRVAIAAGVGVDQLPLYTIVAGLCGRIAIVSSAITAVMFPQLSAAHSAEDVEAYSLLSSWGFRATALGTGTIAATLFWSGHDFLSLWISPAFAGDAATMLRFLAVGFAVESMGQLGYAANDARGHIRRSMVSGVVFASLGIAGAGIGAAAVDITAGAAAFAAALTAHGAVGLALGFGRRGLGSAKIAATDLALLFIVVGVTELAVRAAGGDALPALVASVAVALGVAAVRGRAIVKH
jgi:O-antigen/teichoic acid export membrane protein